MNHTKKHIIITPFSSRSLCYNILKLPPKKQSHITTQPKNVNARKRYMMLKRITATNLDIDLLLALGRLLHYRLRLVKDIPFALETFHLSCLELAEIQLAHVDSAELVTHDVGGDVLLGALLVGLGLTHRLLEHSLVGFLDSTDAEVDTGTMFLQLDAGKLLAGALGLDGVDAEAEDSLGGWVVGVLGGGGLVSSDNDNETETLDVNLVGCLAAEEVDEHGLGQGEAIRYRRFARE